MRYNGISHKTKIGTTKRSKVRMVYFCNKLTAILLMVKIEVDGLDDFHFLMVRHTYTSNLLLVGAKPTDVQELLGHSDVNTTMPIYAHATREAKNTPARLLDNVVGGKLSLISTRTGKSKRKYLKFECLIREKP